MFNAGSPRFGNVVLRLGPVGRYMSPTKPKAPTSPMMYHSARRRPVDRVPLGASDFIDCVGVVISTGRHCCLSERRTLNAQHVWGTVKVRDGAHPLKSGRRSRLINSRQALDLCFDA